MSSNKHLFCTFFDNTNLFITFSSYLRNIQRIFLLFSHHTKQQNRLTFLSIVISSNELFQFSFIDSVQLHSNKCSIILLHTKKNIALFALHSNQTQNINLLFFLLLRIRMNQYLLTNVAQFCLWNT